MNPDRPPCLLVVGDDPVTCARLEGYFRQEGYTVLTAASGAEMGPMAQEFEVTQADGAIDLVVLDDQHVERALDP
ncbi:MAG: hypothetical protein KA896_19065, partial [Leptothrix sp. (in: Bacteria)]|nr:hypothetical protein [Leptothrix sp. (in: b-proteobacteria)]